MNKDNDASIIELFQSRVRKEFPEFAASLVTEEPDGFGNFMLLDVPWPPNPKRCSLSVLYRGDCFEVAFSVAETRGPAECNISLYFAISPSAVEWTIDFLREIVSSRIFVDVFRYRFFWFQPFYLAFFREATKAPRRRVVETLCWSGSRKAGDVV